MDQEITGNPPEAAVPCRNQLKMETAMNDRHSLAVAVADSDGETREREREKKGQMAKKRNRD